MKKIICLVLSIFTLSFHAVSAASSDISVLVNGVNISFDQSPYIDSNSRTMVPIRFISEALSSDVKWDDKQKKVIITKGDKKIILTIGQNTAEVNEEKVKLDTTPVIKGGRTFVPLRFVGEAFDATVTWDDKKRIVEVSTIPKFPESSYYNELYNLFTLVPKGLSGSIIEQKAKYNFKEDGSVSTLDYTTLDSFNKIPLELSPTGVIFSPAKYDTAESFGVEIFKNVKITQKQLIGQYIYFTDLKPEDLDVIDKNGTVFVTTKGFEPFDIKEIGYNLKSKKLLVYHQNNLYAFSFIYDPNDTKYLSDDIMESIINSIEINGTGFKLETKGISGNGKNTVEISQTAKTTYTVFLSKEQNELRLKNKYFPKNLDLLNMVRIEGGTFIDDEGDKITVKPFYVSKNLVTINEWNKYSEDKIDIKKYNSKYNINIKSDKYPAIFETEEIYGMVSIKDSLSLFKFCNNLSKSQGLEQYYTFVKNDYGVSTLFEHNNGFRLLSEYELKYILRKTKSQPYKNSARSNTIAPVGSSDKNVFGIYDYETNVAEVTDFDYVFKIKDSNQMLCGFRYAMDADDPVQELIIDFFSN
ncbi:MAG TPA: copper amine oxidase N-terminal domain-containing protein [Acetivibrio sp.]|nr:copper amine oxidase [Clostridium sp.]HOQ38017.1 copper amine oxidase N-terminal domain-containing protein [Acetivibrio sp.]HQA59014.1 copper amine oxidase N-terminal domain-containing protein [Acetivibrio sp.]